MCLAVIKPKGVDIQQFKDNMSVAFFQNSDGAGYAISKPKSVYIKKGFMDFDELWENFSRDCKEENTALLHFRLATAGSVCPENCHPYPITGDSEKLLRVEVECKAAGVHNGIFSQFNDIARKMNISDTLAFLFKFNKELILAHTDDNLMELLESYIGTYNKVGVLFPNDEFYKLGSWKEKDGVLFSNLYFDWSYTPKYGSLDGDGNVLAIDNYYDSYFRGVFDGVDAEEDDMVLATKIDPPEGEFEVETSMFCPKCERELDVADYCSWCGWTNFCLKCGAHLSSDEEQSEQVCSTCGFKQPNGLGKLYI